MAASTCTGSIEANLERSAVKIRGVPRAGGDSRVQRVENICVCRQNEACGLTFAVASFAQL
jgi:hypothetical protein